MQRRFALPLFAAVCLATLPGMGVAQQTGAPGTITTVAGTGEGGSSPDGGPANQTVLNGPEGIAVDAAGNFFIADSFHGRVLKVSPSGMISTVAARLTNPGFIALDQAGNLFIKDGTWDNFANRVVKLSPAGLLTTVAGTGTPGFSGDGGPATEARLYGPGGVAVDAAGNLFIADEFNYRIRKVSPDGIITTVAGSGPAAGESLSPAFSRGDGGLATKARLIGTAGLALDRSGNLFVSEAGYDGSGWHRVYRVR